MHTSGSVPTVSRVSVLTIKVNGGFYKCVIGQVRTEKFLNRSVRPYANVAKVHMDRACHCVDQKKEIIQMSNEEV